MRPPRDVVRLLQDLGFPPAIDLQDLPPGRGTTRGRVTFDAHPALVIERAGDRVGARRLDALGVAVRHLSMSRALPVPQVFRQFREPWPGVASTEHPGERGDDLLRRRPDLASAILELLGRTLSTLAAVPEPTFGTMAGPASFLPTRRTWKEEWAARVDTAFERARSAGTDLGPVSDALFAGIRRRLDSLDAVEQFTLVHTDLVPGRLRITVEPKLQLSGIEGWYHAIAGDPLLDLAGAFEVAPAVGRRVVSGYGRDRVARLVADDAGRARLEVYGMSRALEVLGQASHLTADDRSRLLPRVARTAVGLLQPDAARAWLASVTSATPSPERPPVAITAGPLRTAAHVLGAGAVDVTTCATWAGAVAALAIAGRRQAPVERASAALASIGHPAPPIPCAPLLDRSLWRDNLVSTALERASRSPGTHLSVTCLALGLDMVDQLGGAVSDQVLRGLESLVYALLAREAMERAEPPPRARELLVHALVALSLVDHLGPPGDLRAALATQVHEAWFAVEPLVPLAATHTDPHPWIHELCASRWEDRSLGALAPCVAFALHRLDADDLPAPATEMLAVLDR